MERTSSYSLKFSEVCGLSGLFLYVFFWRLALNHLVTCLHRKFFLPWHCDRGASVPQDTQKGNRRTVRVTLVGTLVAVTLEDRGIVPRDFSAVFLFVFRPTSSGLRM